LEALIVWIPENTSKNKAGVSPKEKWGSSRFSIPFFLHPRSEMRLDCLESCVTSSYQLHYESISAGEYLNERLHEIGLKK
jgi:isopenicillin N synthase-like dioxygenase